MASFGYTLFQLAITGAVLFFGLIFPAYSTIQAIETPTEADNAHWLNYWLIYSLITVSESLLWPILKWVPLYSILKAAFLAWLVLPQTKGARWVWENVLAPGIIKLRTEADKQPAVRNFLDQHNIKVGQKVKPSKVPGGKTTY